LEPVSTLMTLFAGAAATLTNLGVLLRGAILAPGAQTVTGCLLAAWPWVSKHWSAYANVLRRARVPLQSLGRRLFGLILQLVPREAEVELAVDETLVRRWGPRVVGVGMHRDAVRSSHRRVGVSPGHSVVCEALDSVQRHARRSPARHPQRDTLAPIGSRNR
jgi:hypothetical protein